MSLDPIDVIMLVLAVVAITVAIVVPKYRTQAGGAGVGILGLLTGKKLFGRKPAKPPADSDVTDERTPPPPKHTAAEHTHTANLTTADAVDAASADTPDADPNTAAALLAAADKER